MDEAPRFRIAIVKETSWGLVYFRLYERRASNVWHDSSPYGPLALERENFHELVGLLTLGARAFGARNTLATLNWEEWNDGLYSARREAASQDERGATNGVTREETHHLPVNDGPPSQEEGAP